MIESISVELLVDYVSIAGQFIVVGGCLECVVIILGYLISTVFNLLKVR